MNWFAWQKSASGNVPVAFDEHPNLTPTMAGSVILSTLRSIPEGLRNAKLTELAKALG